MKQLHELAVIGKIKRVEGKNGDLRVLIITDKPERFDYLERVYMVDPRTESAILKEVENTVLKDDGLIIKIKGIDDRTTAFDYRKFLLAVPMEERAELDDDEYYVDDLEGLSVVTKDGDLWGQLSYVISTGGVDVYVITDGSNEYMLPAKKDFVVSVDIENKKMIISPPEGLKEIYQQKPKEKKERKQNPKTA